MLFKKRIHKSTFIYAQWIRFFMNFIGWWIFYCFKANFFGSMENRVGSSMNQADR